MGDSLVFASFRMINHLDDYSDNAGMVRSRTFASTILVQFTFLYFFSRTTVRIHQRAGEPLGVER